MKTYNEFMLILESFDDPNFDCARFDYLIEQTDDCIIDGVEVSLLKISSIRRFYEKINPYNRAKVVGLINNNITNIDKVHKIVIDYEKSQTQRKN